MLQSSFDGFTVLDVAAKLASAGIVEYWVKINDILLFTKTSESGRLDIFSKVSIQGVFYLIENWTYIICSVNNEYIYLSNNLHFVLGYNLYAKEKQT